MGMLLFLGACQPNHPAEPASQPLPPVVAQPLPDAVWSPDVFGPTVKSQTGLGFELINRKFRVVISNTTGNVVFWGYAEHDRNIVYQRGMYTTLSTLPDTPAKGAITAGDADSWQYKGDDDNHIAWKKIYSLKEDVLSVSIIVQNNRPTPLDAAINLNGDLPSLRIMKHNPELFEAFGGYGTVLLEGYNTHHYPSSQPMLPTLLQSDFFHLAPAERQAFTSSWVLSP